MDHDDFHDWYAELEVAPDATAVDIKRAWRRLAQRHHPDRNAGDTSASARFIRVRSALEVLSNPASRAQFDEQRKQWLARRESRSSLVPEGPSFSFRQWWQDVRDDRRRLDPLPQGDRASALLRVPLSHLFSDTTHTVRLRVGRTCPACLGARPRCPVCHGTGQRLVPGAWQVVVPAGTTDGALLRLAGQGHQGPRFGAPGDVLVTVAWTARGIWRWREGRLVGRMRVRRSQLLAGAILRVRAPDGHWGRFTLSPGTDEARLVRLPGLGLPDRLGRRADAFIECFTNAP